MLAQMDPQGPAVGAWTGQLALLMLFWESACGGPTLRPTIATSSSTADGKDNKLCNAVVFVLLLLQGIGVLVRQHETWNRCHLHGCVGASSLYEMLLCLLAAACDVRARDPGHCATHQQLGKADSGASQVQGLSKCVLLLLGCLQLHQPTPVLCSVSLPAMGTLHREFLPPGHPTEYYWQYFGNGAPNSLVALCGGPDGVHQRPGISGAPWPWWQHLGPGVSGAAMPCCPSPGAWGNWGGQGLGQTGSYTVFKRAWGKYFRNTLGSKSRRRAMNSDAHNAYRVHWA